MATIVRVVNDKIVTTKQEDAPRRKRKYANGQWIDVYGTVAQSRMTRGIKAKHRTSERVYDVTRGVWCDKEDMRPQFGYKRDKWTKDKNDPLPPKVTYVWSK